MGKGTALYEHTVAQDPVLRQPTSDWLIINDMGIIGPVGIIRDLLNAKNQEIGAGIIHYHRILISF